MLSLPARARVALAAVALLLPFPARGDAGALPVPAAAPARDPATGTPAAPGAPAAASAPASAPAPASVVLAADVPSRSRVARRRLREILAATEPGAEVEALRTEIRQAEAAVAAMAADPRNEPSPDLTAGALADIVNDWTATAERMRHLDERIGDATRSGEAMLAELVAAGNLWERTRREGEAARWPDPLITRVSTLLSEIRSAEATVRDRWDALLVLQDRVSDIAARVADQQEQADAAATLARKSRLGGKREPLWTVVRRGDTHRPLPELVGASLRSWRDQIVRFARLNPAWLAVHLGIFLVIWNILARLRRRATSSASPGDVDAAAIDHAVAMLSRPAAAAAVLALAATTWIHARAPVAVVQLAAILSVVPLFRLLPRRIDRGVRLLAHGVAAFWLLARLLEALPALGELQRIGSALHAGLAAVLLLVVIVRNGSENEAHGAALRLETLARGLAPVAFLLLVASAALNIGGLAGLGVNLDLSTASVAMSGLFLAVVTLVLEAVWTLALRSRLAQRSNIVARHQALLARRGRRSVRALAGIVWILHAMWRFDVLEPTTAAVRAALTSSVRLGEISLSPGDLLAFGLVLWAAYLISRFARFVLGEDVLPRMSLHRGVSTAIITTVHYCLMLAGLLLALAALGLDMTKLTVLAGAFGVGLAFGMQTIVSNFISGLILLYERPISIGDVVQVSGTVGEIKRIGIRSSTVRTVDGADVIIPNATLITGEVTNWTLTDRLKRIEMPVGVAYGSPLARIPDVLLGALAGIEGVRTEPKPHVTFRGFGDSSVDFILRFWTTWDEQVPVTPRVATAVAAALEREGITIPFPQRDLHVVTLPPGQSGPLPPTS